MTKQIKGVTVEELTIGDEYLFEEILLRNKEITKQLIETLLGIPDISDIKYISVEDVHHNTHKNKGIRIDVYIKSQAGVAYIVELQRKDTKEIEKRMRYYQAVSDSRQLPTGHPYKDLKDSYVIFICREDIFGKGLYKYSFENTCLELEGLKLNDGAYKIVFNTQGTKGEVCKSSLAFLNLVEGISSDDPLVKKIEAAAEKIKADEMWREAYMQSLLRDQDKFDAGEENAKIENAKSFLALGISVEDVAKGTGLSVDEVKQLEEEVKADEKWREAYMQGILRDQDKFDAGEDSGRDKEKIEIAKNLLAMEMSIGDVSKGTGLSIEEVEKLVMK